MLTAVGDFTPTGWKFSSQHDCAFPLVKLTTSSSLGFRIKNSLWSSSMSQFQMCEKIIMRYGSFVTIGPVNHAFRSDFTVTTLVSLVPRSELSHHPVVGYPAGGDAMWETVASTSLWVLHIYCKWGSKSCDCTHLIYYIMHCLNTGTTCSSGLRVCVFAYMAECCTSEVCLSEKASLS